jgi:hypothetical protein
MLFHITGPSGSGKTTLGKKLANLPNTVVIDTDDIDDTNGIQIITNPEHDKLFTSEESIGGFWNLLERKNMEELSVLLEKNKGKNIIMVGMTIYPPRETDVHGYSIDVESNNLYTQLNSRTLESICSNCGELGELIKNEKNKYKADLMMLFKFKIRRSFPIIPIQIDEGIELRKKHCEEIGYKYMKQDDIVQDITKLIDIEQQEKSKKINQATQARTKAKAKTKTK